MAKVNIEVVYAIEMEIGDVPHSVVESALKEDKDFNIWELPGSPVLEAVTIASLK